MIWIFRSKRYLLSLMVIGLLIALLGMTVITASAAVTLVSFTATPGNGQVLVAWGTATEFDNAGFFVYRSINQKRSFVAISPLIPSTGSGSIGSQYSYLDTNVTNGVVYYYELIAISSTNVTQSFAPVGPIIPGSVTATATQISGGTSTPTATNPTNVRTGTPTHTPTSLRTPTVTQGGAYPGPVQSPSPTNLYTLTPGPTTSPAQTPGANTPAVDQLSQAGGPTSTLRPFPSVTYEFPDASQTSMDSIQPTPTQGDNGISGWVNVARLGPITLIVMVWVLLGGWFYLTLRRMD